LFRQIGYFDTAYRTYGVDPDLTTQVLLAGYKVVYTRQVAIHHDRDHVASPGAIPAKARVEERRATHQTYEQKYRALIKRRPAWQRLLYGGFWRAVVRPAYSAARGLGIPLEAWLGYNERDWSNLLYARHISVFDFVTNRNKPYYLVQSMRLGRENGDGAGTQAQLALPPRMKAGRHAKDSKE
jgi:GT2 family glycosyltransferase